MNLYCYNDEEIFEILTKQQQNSQKINVSIIALASATVTPSPFPECSKVAVCSRELCISERAKRVSGSLIITEFCYLTKTASATILSSEMAFLTMQKGIIGVFISIQIFFAVPLGH